MLHCQLTQPTGCKHGDSSILSGRVLEKIIGTASGVGFSRYELELIYNGTTSIPAGIVYADAGGNPAPALTFGNHQVTSGTLGFVDVQQAIMGAGAGFLTSTNYEVRLHVVGIDTSRKHCNASFQLASARAFIQKVGAAWAHNYVNPNETLCRIPPPVGHPINEASVGGNIFVKGSAKIYGCAAEKIAEVHMWAVPDDTFSFPQPTPGDPIVAPPGSQKISEVFYTDDTQRDNNVLDATTDEGVTLTFNPGWTTRMVCNFLPFPPWFVCWNVPDIVERYWDDPTGKYTLLLAVKDTAGHTYFDIQRVWRDNAGVKCHITFIGGLNGCLDLRLSKFAGTTCELRGFAWDRAIRAADLQAAPNDNFVGYSMSYQKNGGGGGNIPVATPGVRVPNVWSDVDPVADGVLANWDIVADLDGGAGPVLPGSPKLPRGEHCAYVIMLSVSDNTLVGEGGSSHSETYPYAINVINDL
jgi:hypothetical protein